VSGSSTQVRSFPVDEATLTMQPLATSPGTPNPESLHASQETFQDGVLFINFFSHDVGTGRRARAGLTDPASLRG
jgi:hypothetical protein